ncbi:MAG: carboxylating nicotinate-nucleotide diphosphorylase [Candidatus Lokiarchaeota archaeon]|nr:carboxylating nicotinate-nucleotide diphosphorylase [Candidatus Lokiarchaeota archaeon]
MSYNRILIEKKLKKFILEDNSFIDISSKSIPTNSLSHAKIIAKSDGYISGLEELEILFQILKVDITFKKKDGDQIQKGDIIAELDGKTKDILLGERVGLNLLCHMSAITTTTRKFVKIIEKSGKRVKIACTRKILPGLRIFEKKAVEIGKGDTHRFNLDDMVLLKSTHLKFYDGNVAELLKHTKLRTSFTKKIEIEVEKVEDVITAVKNGADIIMLDNMNPDIVQDAMNLLKQQNLRDQVIIEVSGNITQENIVDYLISEPDIISTSILTQKPTEFVDISLQLD